MSKKLRITDKPKMNAMFLPVVIALTILPLIVRGVVVTLDIASYKYIGSEAVVDTFSFFRSYVIIAIAAIMLIIFIVFFKKLYSKKDKKINFFLISISIFILFTLLSAIFSDNTHVSFFGAFDRAEGFITILCYCILFLYAIFSYEDSNDYRYIVIGIFIVVGINLFLGAFQYFGQDLMNTEIGQKFVLSQYIRDRSSGINLLYEKGKLYGTLFHYNYMGSLVAMFIPILLTLSIFIKEKYSKFLLIVFSIFSILLLFGSTSRGGLIGIATAIIFGFVMFIRIIIQHWKSLIISLVALSLIIVGTNVVTNGTMFERIPAMISDINSVFVDTSDFDYRNEVIIKDITIDKNIIKLHTQNGIVNVNLIKSDLSLTDENDEDIEYTLEGALFKIKDKRFKNISMELLISREDAPFADVLKVNIKNQAQFFFKINKDSHAKLMNDTFTREISLVDAPSIGFKGKEKIGSMRGYIWSRTLPLLENNLILGSGPDTFMFEFPQNDLIGKLYAYDSASVIIDKPHNLYLQIFIQNGGIALLAFMAIIILYLIDSLRLYSFKKYYSKEQLAGIVTTLSIIGYLFAGIFNDSSISVAPVFWILLGVGVATNYKNKKDIGNI